MKNPILALTACGLLGVSAIAQDGKVETRIGTLEFEHGLPTPPTVERLFNEMDFQRGCMAYLWALPTVSFAQSLEMARLSAKADFGDVITYQGYDKLPAILTPNVTTPYITASLHLGKDGPMVVEIPAGLIAGSAMDFWQRALTDFGVTGPDQGKGAKFLFVGPGQEVPEDDGYLVIESPTLKAALFYRALDPDPAVAEAAKRGVRIYPYSKRANPPEMKFLDPDPKVLATLPTIPRGMAFWEMLNREIQEEPVHDRDRFFVGMLRTLGIEKGKEFEPDERQKKILEEAAFIGEAMAKANSFDKRFPGSRYRPDAHWDYMIMADPAQDLENYSQFDERAAYFYEAVVLSKGMVSRTPGEGQAYLASYRDAEGHAFDGGKSYKLRVPANPPMKQFWSVTLYDLDSRAVIQNEQKIAERSSRHELVKNEDGSVDIYFGPKAPEGFEKNWIPTVPGKAWFTYFRLYAPTESFLDASWPLPDIEKLK